MLEVLALMLSNGRARAATFLFACVPAVTQAQLPISKTLQSKPPASSTSSAAKSSAVDSDSVSVSPESPRASLRSYFDLAGAGDFAAAARYLDVAPAQHADAGLMARRLKLVLDHYAWIDLSSVSADAAGDTTDGLPTSVDLVATVRTPDGLVVPVRVRRATSGVGADSTASTIWRFSRATVDRIPALYATLGNRWLVDRLPAPLLRVGPFDIVWWQWLAIIPVVLLVGILGAGTARIARAIMAVAARRTSTTWDDVILGRLGGPLTLLCALILAALAVPVLGLYAPAAARVYTVLRVGYAATFFWAAWRLVDVGRHVLAGSRWAVAMPASRSLVPLGSRVLKVLVAALALVTILSTLGYPVASLLAGLGIGGLAVALAAQKTVENLFGAFSIGVDQPFREGDFVKVDNFVGTVEAIGLRSTRFRTLDRTIITLPNGRLADMRLESFAARDRLLLNTVVGLVYETTASQMREVIAGFNRVLRSQPNLWPNSVTVRFTELASSSLNVQVMAWFATADWNEFQRIREQVLLEFMEVVEEAGTSFAFPSTTVYLAGSAVAQPRPQHA